jgi:hypothetical protein
MQETFAHALAALSVNDKNKVTIASAGGIPPFVALLASPSVVQECAMSAQSNLRANVENVAEIVLLVEFHRASRVVVGPCAGECCEHTTQPGLERRIQGHAASAVAAPLSALSAVDRARVRRAEHACAPGRVACELRRSLTARYRQPRLRVLLRPRALCDARRRRFHRVAQAAWPVCGVALHRGAALGAGARVRAARGRGR